MYIKRCLLIMMILVFLVSCGKDTEKKANEPSVSVAEEVEPTDAPEETTGLTEGSQAETVEKTTTEEKTEPETLGTVTEDSTATTEMEVTTDVPETTGSDELSPTIEPTVTVAPTVTNTPKPTSTNTPKPTATNTPKPTATSTPKPTATPKIDASKLEIDGMEIARYAVEHTGAPYVSGGESYTKGVDCVGFTKIVYRDFGINMLHGIKEQIKIGVEVPLSEALPGDLIIEQYPPGSSWTGHAGIYIGCIDGTHYAISASPGEGDNCVGIGSVDWVWGEGMQVRRVFKNTCKMTPSEQTKYWDDYALKTGMFSRGELIFVVNDYVFISLQYKIGGYIDGYVNLNAVPSNWKTVINKRIEGASSAYVRFYKIPENSASYQQLMEVVNRDTIIDNNTWNNMIYGPDWNYDYEALYCVKGKLLTDEEWKEAGEPNTDEMDFYRAQEQVVSHLRDYVHYK